MEVGWMDRISHGSFIETIHIVVIHATLKTESGCEG